MLTEMKTSAVVLCIVTISSLEPLQVLAPKEQPSQWRGEQHRWWNGQPQWGNEQGQNPQRNRLEPLQVMAAPKKTLRWNRDGGKPYSRTEQPMQPWYDYPSGAYAADPQNSQYNVAANMMPGASGILPLPLPTSEQNTGDQTLNNAIETANRRLRELTAAKWFERKLAEQGKIIKVETRRFQQAQVCLKSEAAIVLYVLSQVERKDPRSAHLWFCDHGYGQEVWPVIEKKDGTTKHDAKLIIGGEEHDFTLIAMCEGQSLHAAFSSKSFRKTDIKSVDSVTLYEV